MEMQLQSILVLCILVVLITLTLILAVLLCCRIDVRIASITTSGDISTTNTIGGIISADNNDKIGEGLHPDIIQNLPMVPYKSIQSLKNVRGRPHGSCTVCLTEFEIGDVVRMLPGCCHVFHPQCIGKWLISNSTCPICRSDLSDPTVLANRDRCLVGDEKELLPVVIESGRWEWDAIVKTLSGRWRKDDSRRIAPLFDDPTAEGSIRDVEIGVQSSSLES